MGIKKIFNVIVITSTFWFSVTILVLMFNNEVTRESLTMLNAPMVVEGKDHKFMVGAGVKPLQPVDRNVKYPWEKEKGKIESQTEGFLSNAAKVLVAVIPRKGRGKKVIYDASRAKMKDPYGLGEGGRAAYLKSEEDKKLAEKYFANHSFNWLLSDKISLDRTLEDVRGEK